MSGERVVLFAPGFVEAGGAQARSRVITRVLAARGWQVRVIARTGSRYGPRLHRTHTVTVLEVPGFNRRRLGGAFFFLIAIPLGLTWGMRATGFIAIQLMSTATVAGICGKLLRVPYMALATISGEISEVGYLQSTRSWRFRRWLLRGATAVVAQTAEAAEELDVLGRPNGVLQIPNPVEIPDPMPPLNGTPRALFTGRLVTQKDLFTLISAWREIAAQHPDSRLTIAGSADPLSSVGRELQEMVAADRDLARTVTMPGWVADIPSLLRSHDVFVLPSLAEGMSNALLEACAYGRVAVASDIAPSRAVLGADYPLIFPTRDAQALRKALTAALFDRSIRQEARDRIRARLPAFAADAVVRQLEDVIGNARSPRY